MRLLGVSGSPRDASTAYLVKEGLRYAEKRSQSVLTEYFSLKGKKIDFCIHCDYCVREKKGCVHKDDMLEAYEKLSRADALLIGSPVYSGSISGQLKTFFDRCRALVARNPDVLRNKVGVGLAVGGDRAGGQEPALLTIHSFFLANKMIPVSGGPFGANLGCSAWSRDLGKEGAEKDTEGLKSLHRTIDRLIEVAFKLKGDMLPQ
ncbi:MAG: flavodoxin family protein [Candidatus Bathyarchaeota archaeon]|nr:MAG: flavodoxin family protein [Candidatus Bathyarchaeota archaeon]